MLIKIKMFLNFKASITVQRRRNGTWGIEQQFEPKRTWLDPAHIGFAVPACMAPIPTWPVLAAPLFGSRPKPENPLDIVQVFACVCCRWFEGRARSQRGDSALRICPSRSNPSPQQSDSTSLAVFQTLLRPNIRFLEPLPIAKVPMSILNKKMRQSVEDSEIKYHPSVTSMNFACCLSRSEYS